MADDTRHRKLHADEHEENGVDEIPEGSLLPQDPTEHASDHLSGGSDELTGINATQIANGDVTNTEFQYLDGVTTYVADKDYVDSKIQGLDWQASVLDIRNDPPSSPSTGDRYIIGDDPTGDWYGEHEKIAEWDGSDWIIIEPNEGFTVWVEANNKSYVYNDEYDTGEWVAMSSTVNHGSLSGLGNDDHTHYLHLDGENSSRDNELLGNLSLGNNSIVNVNLVDGINVSDHDHTGGSDGVNIPNAGLVNDSVTVTAGTNLSGGGTVSLGSTITINNDISDLDDLGDVSSVTYTDGNVLRADGSGFVSTTLDHDDLSGVSEDNHHNAFEALLDDSDSVVSPDGNNRIKIDTDNTIDAVANGSVITLSTTDEAGVTTHSELDGLDADDHTQYLLVDGTRSMDGNLNMSNNQVNNITSMDASGTIDFTSGTFKPRTESQSGTPSLVNGEFCVWEDTGNDQIWLVFRLNDENHYVEVTG